MLLVKDWRVSDFIAQFGFTSVGECKVKETTTVKVRIEVFQLVTRRKIVHRTRKTREYYLCYLMSCDFSPLFRCVTHIQSINLICKVKYNVLIETIWRRFLVICFIYLAYSGYVPGVRWQCLCAIIMQIISLYLFINPSKILFYYEGTFNVFRGPIWEKRLDFWRNGL